MNTKSGDTKYTHMYYSRFIQEGEGKRHFRYFSKTPTFSQNNLDVIGRPIAVWSQFISGVSAVNLSV
jgi:hypothetical protein